MPVTNLCRLCVKLCGSDARSLYDAIGQQNEAYVIAVKFFHPMYLNVDQGNECTVMCSQCWQHISSFHTFQEMVFETQRKLLLEETDIEIQTSMYNENVSNENANGFEGAINCNDETISLPDLKIIEDLSSYDNIQQYCEDPGDLVNNSQPLITNVPTGTVIDSESTTSAGPRKRIRQIGNHQAAQSKIKRRRQRRRNKAEMDRVIARWRPILNCEICATSCESVELLRNHFVLVHPKVPFYVSCCNRKFSLRSRIEEHALKHIDPNALCCKICNARFGSKVALQRHNLDLHPSAKSEPNIYPKKIHISRKNGYAQMDAYIARYMARLQCTRCNESFANFPLLKLHFTQHHPGAECYVECCQRRFSTRSKLKEHINFHLDPDVFKCKRCGKQSTSYINLKNHCLRIHYRQRQTNYRSSSNASTTIRNRVSYKGYDNLIAQMKPNLECTICYRTFSSFTGLQTHFRTQHHIDEFHVLCCEQKFFTRPTLVEHLRLHNNPDAFKCQTCAKSYKFQKSYLDHIRLRHPEINVHGLFNE